MQSLLNLQRRIPDAGFAEFLPGDIPRGLDGIKMAELLFHLSLGIAQQFPGAAGFAHVGPQQSAQALLQFLQIFSRLLHDFKTILPSWIPREISRCKRKLGGNVPEGGLHFGST